MQDVAEIRALLPTLLEEELESLPALRANVRDLSVRGDRDGQCTEMLSLCLRHVAALEFLVNRDVAKFRGHTSEVTQLCLDLFERFSGGAPIAKYLLSWDCSEKVMAQLATGRFDLARGLAAKLGVHPALAQQSCREDAIERGPALKAVLLGNLEIAEGLVGAFETDCGIRRNRYQLGYARLLSAILAKDLGAANVAMKLIVKRHLTARGPSGYFGEGWPQLLCVWGVGMANLAISRGLPVSPIPPLIPAELLVGDLDATDRA